MQWISLRSRYIYKDIDNRNSNIFRNKNNSDDGLRVKVPTLAWAKIYSQNAKAIWALEELRTFNAAFWTKHGWNILTKSKNNGVRLIKTKYLRNNPYFQQITKSKKSYAAWKKYFRSYIYIYKKVLPRFLATDKTLNFGMINGWAIYPW